MPEQTPSLFSDFTQATRLLRLHTPLGPDRLLAECVRGEEAITDTYAFTISALSLDAGIGLRSLVGQPALLELLTSGDGRLRAFHGLLTAVELNGANGGMARYTLTLRPWSAFLAHTRDSCIFQDLSVPDIIDAVFKTWQGRGRLAPDWRFDLADPGSYPKRSLATQYQESDLAFVERLMREEGLFYYFEHEGDAESPDLGSHRMVIADHNGAFQPGTQASVRYTQPGAVMKEDSMDRWRCELKLQTNAISLSSWDYRTLDRRPVSSASVHGAGPEMAIRDLPRPYAYPSRSHGQRLADRQLESLEARREVFTGAGTVRTLAPGTTFTLSDHAVHDREDEDARSFVVIRACHLMHNNLSAEMKARIASGLGAPPMAADMEIPSRPGERPLYRNRIDAIRHNIPYRADCTLHPRPTIRGQQTAIVVGPAGSVVHTDRDHRIKVQFHWQSGIDSHSRLSHPSPDGHSGAPGDDSAGTWVRVATPLASIAGANWGSHALPRVGQEVLVDFLEGDIDRPVIIGALYNGAGARDAQHNTRHHGAGPATGNAPAWFPGEAGAHGHAAVLSGLKSQAMQASQLGTGAYSQLVFDDSPGQARVALQRHAGAHQGTAELNLGHLRHQVDNQRMQAVGFGAELKTAHALAMRAGQGMLLSTDRAAGGAHMAAREALAQIDAARQLQESLAATAQKHNAVLAGESKAIAGMQDSADAISGTTAWPAPQLQLSSPLGIVAVTPADAVLAAGATTAICAGQDINFAAQGNSYRAAVAGIGLFTYGKASAKDKPNQETGIRMHAASGKLSSQSQAGETRLTADKGIAVASVAAGVRVVGKQHVLLTAQGACLKLQGGDIMLHAPGKVEFKAGMRELAGPKDGSAS
ncbi:Actin cross-linking toxin VgrG1 [Massilia sp. Bi118]|uniref:type VI secretion system Vgr family protein n=1 Tax=Massilia sp. Bi118 TaxID=2822346 RepID=UPI001D68FEC6|nr:type VI secretion system Vgr family protein [Massilia sp. Bi118]CAH0247133.1 Actin cross-linking toxin VgrG1 [Massilia sp. Bi118]